MEGPAEGPPPAPPHVALLSSKQLWPGLPRDVEQQQILCPHVLQGLAWLPGMQVLPSPPAPIPASPLGGGQPHFLLTTPLPDWPYAYRVHGGEADDLPVPKIGHTLLAHNMPRIYGTLLNWATAAHAKPVRELTDVYIKPLLRRALAQLLHISYVCRRWAEAAAPWFSFLYYYYAGVLHDSHQNLYGRRSTLPPELCRRYLLLGLYQPASHLDAIVHVEAGHTRVDGWDDAERRLRYQPLVLQVVLPGVRRQTPFESVILEDEQAAIARGRALPVPPDPDVPTEGYRLVRVHSFQGYEKVAPPLSGSPPPPAPNVPPTPSSRQSRGMA